MLMERLKEASNSVLWKSVLVLVAVSFVLSGVAGYVISRTDTSAVKINGEEISQQLFQQQYNNEYQRLSQQLGAQFAAVADTPEFTNGLRSTVLNRLIDQELLRQYASELKLAVSDERVKQEIVSSPIFQVDGKFNNAAYQQLLRQNNMTADTYAEYVREGLRLEQLQTGLSDTEFSVPAQQDEFVKLFFQQRKVRLATLPLAEELAKQTVTEQEIQDFYNNNKTAFLVPETVKVQYLDLTAATVEKNVNVTDVEIAQYYQDNKSQFMAKSQQRLGHIQFANETDALDAYQALQGGADFAELAKTKSLDTLSAVKGGDLGWLNEGDVPAAFEKATLTLEVGQYSQPVKVDNNFHIIKVEERKTAAELPLSAVKDQIANQIRRDLLNNQFYSVEKQIAEKAFEDQSSLQAAAKVADLEIRESDYFSRTAVPAELNFPAVINAVFDSDVAQGGVNSEPMNVGEQHSIVVRVVEHKPEGTKSLQEAKADIETDLKRQKAESVVWALSEELVKALNNDSAPSQKVNFGEEQNLVYAENLDPALNNVIFSMMKPEKGKTLYHSAKADNGDIVIIALSAVTEGKPTEEELAQVSMQTAQAERINLQNNLLKSLRARAKIEINEEFIRQVQE